MKIVLFSLALISLLFSADVKKDSAGQYLKEKNVKENTVIAKVGKQIILQKHVDKVVSNKLQKTFFHKTISNEKRKEYNKKALEDLIQNELLYAYAKRNELLIKKEEIEYQIQKMIDNIGSVEKFEKTIKELSLTREEIKRNIDISKTIQLIYTELVEVKLDDDYLKEYYEENKAKYLKPESRKMQIVIVTIDPQVENGLEIAQKKAKEAYAKIVSGESFDDVAAKYSNDLTRIKGGNLGYVHKGTYPFLDENAFSLKDGELSELLSDNIGFYIVKVIDTKPAEQVSFIKVKEKMKKELKTQREADNLSKLVDSEKKFTKVEIL